MSTALLKGDLVTPTTNAWLRFLNFAEGFRPNTRQTFPPTPPSLRVDDLGRLYGNPNLADCYMLEGISYWWKRVELDTTWGSHESSPPEYALH